MRRAFSQVLRRSSIPVGLLAIFLLPFLRLLHGFEQVNLKKEPKQTKAKQIKQTE